MNIATDASSKLAAAVSAFGKSAKLKLSNPSATGSPEDQLRAPFERLLTDLAEIAGIPASKVSPVGESSVTELKTRPDYAVTIDNTLMGFVELKAPGKGADPRKFKDPHDKAQWERLRSLPNLIYTDGNEFSLWQDGTLAWEITRLEGDVIASGSKLKAPPALVSLFQLFFAWKPIPPRNARELAITTARLCRLLRDEVTEQLQLKSEALTNLAVDWRKVLFPDATDERFADGYAQAVTFGMLMARSQKISLTSSLHQVGTELGRSSTLIGAALRVLTDSVEAQRTLKTAIATLTRVLDQVDWAKISKGNPDAWLYFYEDFLAIYDNDLRKQTGSYYTPAPVVQTMVSLVDEALRSGRFALHQGLAGPAVTLADPAAGTGTFILAVLRKIADTIAIDEGSGAVRAAVHAALARLIAFEMQLGPFSVAQLRISAEVMDLTHSSPKTLRMYVTNTLGNPYDDEGWIPELLAPIARSRKEANKIKREEPITVVIGNPPYKERAIKLGGWIQAPGENTKEIAPLTAWMPPADWAVSAHTKHLHNLYIYFWRWATWKVFDHGPGSKAGIICFITVAGFLSGPGFQKMREYLRRTCDDIWVIDCSPEGFQADVANRIFQAVQQPVCIVLASRSAIGSIGTETPAAVRFRALQSAKREEKFNALSQVKLSSNGWVDCPTEWRAPFLPTASGAWITYPALQDFFVYNGSGVMPGRQWVIAPDSQSLETRWDALIAAASKGAKEHLFHPHLRNNQPGDRHTNKVIKSGLPGFPVRVQTIADEQGKCNAPIRYGYRSFDRQWIIPDNRLINQPNPELWESRSPHQIYLTALQRHAPTGGPALTFTALIPDHDHYKGSFAGRVFPLWRDGSGTESNVRPRLLEFLRAKYGRTVSPEDVVSYIAAIASHPGFIKRFKSDLATPGLRIPVTATPATFLQASELGRTVIWLHTFGERMADPAKGHPAQPPRLPASTAPRVISAISDEPDAMPDAMDYDQANGRLLVGEGFIEGVDARVWEYAVSGKQVLTQWFSYRKAHRERPLIGDRRLPSPLGDIHPDHWLPEYTTELINVVNVLGLLVDLEPKQDALLAKICSGPLITVDELQSAGGLELPTEQKTTALHEVMNDMFENADD